MQLQLSEERQAQLNDYAQRHRQNPAIALDQVLASALEWDRLEFQEAVEGIRQGYDDAQAGGAQILAEVFAELRDQHGLPR